MAGQGDGRMRIHNNSFQAGTSVDPKLAVASGYYLSQNLDNRTKPSQLSVLPAPRTIANNVGLLLAMDQDLNGVRWGVSAGGGVYSIDVNNTVSQRAHLTTGQGGSAGLFYNQVTDMLYIPGSTTVSLYGQVTNTNSGGPKFLADQFGPSASTANGCVNLYNPVDGFFDGAPRNNLQSIGTGITPTLMASSGVVATYATNGTWSARTSISELPSDFCFFAPDIEPFVLIYVYIANKGTGDWTLTLHDSLNNTLSTVTLANGGMVNGYNGFTFPSPVRALVNASQTGKSATYHFHLTTTSGDGTVGVINPGQLNSCDFVLFANRLIGTANGWHPTGLFTGSGVPLLCIGNGQYLATYNFGNDSNPTNSQFQRHALTFKQGYEVCGLTYYQQFIVVACERRSNNSSRNFQDGALYLWDGSTQAPNIFIDIPMGAPYGIYNHNGVVYFSCNGSLFAYSGGQTVIKVRKQAFYQNTDYLGAVDSTIVNPNMMASRYNLLLDCFPSSTTNNQINYGVNSWGSVELTFPNSYIPTYQLANGLTTASSSLGSNLKIGCIYNFVDSLYISWSYTDPNGQLQYGLDLLDNFSTSAPTFLWQSLVWDGGVSYKIKLGQRVKVTCRPLPAGSTLQAGYSLDGGPWVWSPPVTTGATGVTVDVNKRFHEIQYGFQGTTTGTNNPPVIIGVTFDVDPLPSENNLISQE